MATEEISLEERSMATMLLARGAALVVTETVVVFVVIIVAIIGNILVLTTLVRNAKLRKAPYVLYIFSFGVSDILTIFLVVLLSIASVIKGQWTFSDAVCQFQGLVLAALTEVTVLTMSLAAADRCFTLVRPAYYIKVATRKVTSILIVSAWLLSIIIPVAFSLNGHKFVFHPGNVLCMPDMKNIDYRFAVASEIVFVIFPLAVVAGCYIEIKRRMGLKRLRCNNTEDWNSYSFTAWEKDYTITRLFGAITAGVLACWIPFLLLDIIDAFTKHYRIPRSIYFLSSILALLSCAIKPFVYCIMNNEVKTEFSKYLKGKRSDKVADLTKSETSRRMKYLRPKTPSSMSNHETLSEEVKEISMESGPATAARNRHNEPHLTSAPRKITVTPFEDKCLKDEGDSLHTSSKKEQSDPLKSPNTEHVRLKGASETSPGFTSSASIVHSNVSALDLTEEVCRINMEPEYARKIVLPPIVQHRLTERIFNTLTPVTDGQKTNESFV